MTASGTLIGRYPACIELPRAAPISARRSHREDIGALGSRRGRASRRRAAHEGSRRAQRADRRARRNWSARVGRRPGRFAAAPGRPIGASRPSGRSRQARPRSRARRRPPTGARERCAGGARFPAASARPSAGIAPTGSQPIPMQRAARCLSGGREQARDGQQRVVPGDRHVRQSPAQRVDHRPGTVVEQAGDVDRVGARLRGAAGGRGRRPVRPRRAPGDSQPGFARGHREVAGRIEAVFAVVDDEHALDATGLELVGHRRRNAVSRAP